MEINIKRAELNDIPIIHEIMLQAFDEYKTAEPPSSALQETREYIYESMITDNEQSAILYENDTARGMVRFKRKQEDLYFYRLSVVPESRGRGYAKMLLTWLENYGREHHIKTLTCKVRQTVPRNIALYESIGYRIVDQEIVHRPNNETVKVVTMRKSISS